MGRKGRGEEAEETVCSTRMEAIGHMALKLSLSSLEDHVQTPKKNILEVCCLRYLRAISAAYLFTK